MAIRRIPEEIRRIPEEIIDQIFMYLPVRYAISCDRPFVKRRLLSNMYLKRGWGSEDPEKLDWLCKYEIIGASEKTLSKAALKGRLNVIQCMFKMIYGLPFGFVHKTFLTSAFYGHVDIVDWLLEHYNAKISTFDVQKAMQNVDYHSPQVDVIKLIHRKRPGEGKTTRAMEFAALTGDLSFVKWLHENSNDPHGHAMKYAAKNGHVSVVRFLHENRSNAAEGDPLDGCPDSSTGFLYECAKSGRVEVVLFLFKHRPECNKASRKLKIWARKNAHRDDRLRILFQIHTPAEWKEQEEKSEIAIEKKKRRAEKKKMNSEYEEEYDFSFWRF